MFCPLCCFQFGIAGDHAFDSHATLDASHDGNFSMFAQHTLRLASDEGDVVVGKRAGDGGHLIVKNDLDVQHNANIDGETTVSNLTVSFPNIGL